MNSDRLLKLALDAGEIMLANGAETPRVEDTMERILSIGGSMEISANAMNTLLVASIHSEQTGSHALSRAVRSRDYNFEKISHVNSLSRALVSGKITLEQAEEEIEKIHHEPYFPLPLVALSYGVGSWAITLVFGGSNWDGAAAFFSGILIGLMFAGLARWKKPYFLSSFLGGILAGFCAMLFYRTFGVDVESNHYSLATIGCIMPLLPGVTMTNGIRDVLEGNFISGSAKMMEALLTAVSTACGMAIPLSIFHF